MIRRRVFLITGLAFAAAPAWAAETRLRVKGAMEQGSLALGTAEPGAKVSVDGQKVRLSPDGVFAFGFAYDQTKPSLITITWRDGAVEISLYTPSTRQYEIQRVNGLPQNMADAAAGRKLERNVRESAEILSGAPARHGRR